MTYENYNATKYKYSVGNYPLRGMSAALKS